MDKTFTEIFLINLTTTTVALIIFLSIIFLNPKINAEIELFLIVGLLVLMNVFSIDWFFMGMENFRIITIRSFIIKLLCLIGTFIFVNEKNDYVLYAIITVAAFGLTNLINFMYSFKFVKLTFRGLVIKKHLKFLLVFFFTSVIISLYTVFDQVLLGFLSTNEDVAIYSFTKQIYIFSLSITLSISTVLIPKLSNLAKNDFPAYNQMLVKSLDYIYLFSIPIVVGLIVLSKNIMWIFGGEEFDGAYISLAIVAILVLIVSLGTWQYDQLFLPLGREKNGLKPQMLMASLSIVLNVLLIPKYGYIGACISLVFAELFGTFFGIYYAKIKINEVKLKYITKSFFKYVVASIIMGIFISSINMIGFKSMFALILSIISGACIYFCLLLLFKERICMEQSQYLLIKMNRLRANKIE